MEYLSGKNELSVVEIELKLKVWVKKTAEKYMPANIVQR